jgi:hypothetical protein
LDFSTIKEKEEQQEEQDDEEEDEEEETWSATLKKKKHMLTGSENSVLRKMFRPKKDEITGGCVVWSFLTCTFHKLFE